MAQDPQVDRLDDGHRVLEINSAEDTGEGAAAVASSGAYSHSRPEGSWARHGAGGLTRAVADVAMRIDAQDGIGRLVEAADATGARLHHQQNRYS